jgi:DNA repair exonuclease SbcCD ATPase subunit
MMIRGRRHRETVVAALSEHATFPDLIANTGGAIVLIAAIGFLAQWFQQGLHEGTQQETLTSLQQAVATRRAEVQEAGREHQARAKAADDARHQGAAATIDRGSVKAELAHIAAQSARSRQAAQHLEQERAQLQKTLNQLTAQVEAAHAAVAALQKTIADRRKTASHTEDERHRAGEALQAVRAQDATATAELDRLNSQTTALAMELARAREAVQALGADRPGLENAINQLDEELRKTHAHVHSPIFQPAPDQQRVDFECYEDRVIVINDENYSTGATVTSRGMALITKRRGEKEGERVTELQRPESAFQREIRAIDPKAAYAFFLVRPSCITTFRQAREITWNTNPDVRVGWTPFPDGTALTRGGGDRSLKAGPQQ